MVASAVFHLFASWFLFYIDFIFFRVDSLTVISDKNIPMRINSQGLINWNPAGIYLVSCSSDITYYPLDQQVCTVKVSTWGYTTNEIFLVYDTQPVELGFYSENGEWELVGAAGEPTQDRARGGQSFSSLSFSITLRRRPLFHALNTILPVVLMAFLIPMVYRLPVDSGEKIGYSLTVLLAYAVYLTLISDNIPSTSVSVCYLSKHILYCSNLIIIFIVLYKLDFSAESYLTRVLLSAVFLVIVLALGVLSVLFVIMVIAAYHKGDKPVTSCMARVGHLMARATCADHGVCCRKKQNQDVVTPIAPESNKLSAELDKKQYLEGESPEAQMTYQEYAIILDHFLFYAYFMTVTLTTFLFTLLGIVHFYTL